MIKNLLVMGAAIVAGTVLSTVSLRQDACSTHMAFLISPNDSDSRSSDKSIEQLPLLVQSSRSGGDLSKQHGEQFIPHVWQEYTRRAFIMITVACCYPALC
jgi:hypothetical protein